jgi:glycosyltransferase involved in cell wall biosynthesis
MKIAVISSYRAGGAANGLRRFSSLFERNNHLQEIYLEDYFTKWDVKTIRITNSLAKRITVNNGLVSTGITHKEISFPSKLNMNQFDLIILGWIADGFWGIKNQLEGKKIIWRFSDLWPISGIEHYGLEIRKLHLFKSFSESKIKFIIRNNIQIVTPSAITRDAVLQSPIPNTLVNNIPTPIEEALFFNGILDHNDRKFLKITFGAKDFTKDNRKGFSTIEYLINYFNGTHVHFDLFGDKLNKIKNDFVMAYGNIDSKKRTEILLSNDICIIPSQIDNLPQVGLEALAAGCIVYVSKGIGYDEFDDFIPQLNIFHSRDDLVQKINDQIEILNSAQRYKNSSIAKRFFGKNEIYKSSAFEKLLEAIDD